MAEPESFLTRILAYIGTQEFRAVSAHELAPGVIAIKDTTGETDVYFDQESWQFSSLRLWAGAPKASDGIGLLPGIGSFPPPKTPDELLEFAQRNLRRTGFNATVWPASVKPLSLPDAANA